MNGSLPHVIGVHREMEESHVYEDVMQLVDWILDGTPTRGQRRACAPCDRDLRRGLSLGRDGDGAGVDDEFLATVDSAVKTSFATDFTDCTDLSQWIDPCNL